MMGDQLQIPIGDLIQTIIAFMRAGDWREGQRILERHPELLHPETDSVMQMMQTAAAAEGDQEAVHVLGERRDFLTRCRQVGIERAFAERIGPAALASLSPRERRSEDNRELAQEILRLQLALAAELFSLRQQGRYQEAIPVAIQLRDLVRDSSGVRDPQYATILGELADLYERIGKYSDAEPIYREGLSILRDALPEDHPLIEQSLKALGEVCARVGKFQEAASLVEQALDLCVRYRGKNHQNIAEHLNILAWIYQQIGDYERAEQRFLQALKILRTVKGQDHPDVAAILGNLAVVYRKMCKYPEAKEKFRQALDIKRKRLGRDDPAIAQTLKSFAGLYRDIGVHPTAERLLLEALEIWRKTRDEDDPDVSGTLHNLAVIYRETGRYSEAESVLRKVLDSQCKRLGENHPDVARSAEVLAKLYHKLERYHEAERLYRQSLNSRVRILGERHDIVAQNLHNLAVLHHETGDYVGAESLYRQALEILQEVNPYTGTADTLNNLGWLCAATGRKDEALALLNDAAAVQERLIGNVSAMSSEWERLCYLATVRDRLDGFLSLVAQFFNRDSTVIGSALDLVLRRKGLASEALAIQRNAVLGGRYPELAPRLRELNRLRTQIARKALAGPSDTGDSPEEHCRVLDDWEALKMDLESELASHIPELNLETKLRTINRRTIAAELPDGAALVEFVCFKQFDFTATRTANESPWKPARYVAFILPAHEPDKVAMIDLGEAALIDQLIESFRTSITGRIENGREGFMKSSPSDPPEVEELREDLLRAAIIGFARHLYSSRNQSLQDSVLPNAGSRLRSAVFDPLLQGLGQRTRLFVSPDGALNTLPFEALPTTDNRRLIDDYQISYLGVGRDLLRFGTISTGKAQPALVIADPDFNWGKEAVQSFHDNYPFLGLNGTREEGQEVADLLKVKPVMTAEALESTLKAYRSPTILHIATHGFFQNDPPRGRNLEQPLLDLMAGAEENRLARLGRMENPMLRSGLALAGANTWAQKGALPPEAEDGILTAEDVTGLDLLDTELVVLSACETGLGTVHVGEGVFGLQRAFILAGAKTLVTSLWKVPDQETRELMTNFYQHLLEGSSRTEALRQARLAIKKTHPHPFYWGAFICQGDPGPLRHS